ncbi:MAG: hypothetical protein QXJ64_10805 [Thermosphaera sp.]
MIVIKTNQSIDLNRVFLKAVSSSIDYLKKLRTGGGGRLSAYYVYRSSIDTVDIGKISYDEWLGLLVGIGHDYIIPYSFTNWFGVTRSVLGEFYINHFCRETCDVYAYQVLPLFFPSRVQLLYFLMKYARTTDVENITNSLRSMLFTGKLFGIQRIALAVYLDLEETYYLQKYTKEKTLITPTDFSYYTSLQLDKEIDVCTFTDIIMYLYNERRLSPPLYLQYLYPFEEKTLVPKNLEEIRVNEKLRTIISIVKANVRDLIREIAVSML